jgi:hypothetical protein
MNQEQFNLCLDKRIELIRSVLSTKAREYSDGNDRMMNFNRAASILKTTPDKALLGMMIKHFVSVLDIVENQSYAPPLIEEKCGDLINYVILLEVMLKEKAGCI